MVAVLLLVLTITAVVALLIYASLEIIRRIQNKKMNAPHKVLKYLYETSKKKKRKLEGTFMSKIEILEAIHINIKDLKSCIIQLKKEGLILDVDEHLTLTKLGVDYYEVFIKKLRKPKWPE